MTDTDAAEIKERILPQLVALSNALGEPAKQYVTLSQGNTSARIDTETFLVKASGVELNNAGPDDFVLVSIERVLSLLEADSLNEEEVRRGLDEARVNPQTDPPPSIETITHALCFHSDEINFVGHTHPAVINELLGSSEYQNVTGPPLSPPESDWYSRPPLLIPPCSPGLELARNMRQRLDEWAGTIGRPPRAILLQEHGLFALGSTPEEVEDETARAVETARIIISK